MAASLEVRSRIDGTSVEQGPCWRGCPCRAGRNLAGRQAIDYSAGLSGGIMIGNYRCGCASQVARYPWPLLKIPGPG
jgi:hypothetical protein